MNYSFLISQWKKEETFAFHGWDFSHIENRHKCFNLPWNYKDIINSFLKDSHKLLDMGTGGGEFLLTLNHPFKSTSVTESFPPNIELCKTKLSPLGINIIQTYDDNHIKIDNNTFDIIINRHESFNPTEVLRILKTKGYFITQQVGGLNNNDLSKKIIKDFNPPFVDNTLENNTYMLKKTGFEIKMAKEAFTPIHFFDVGAFVYFAKIIQWEFPDFSVDKYLDKLIELQKEIDRNGYIEGTEHRFIIIAYKN